jgi:2-polyprenyl-3-methyl-5-hydroxy-6-metoxy-1,4-benzoquinol methylase
VYRAWFEGHEAPVEVVQSTEPHERGYSGFDPETWLDMYRFAAASCATALWNGACVLDAGCGSGYGADYLSGIGCNVTAIDASDEAVRYAALRAPGAVVLQRSLENELGIAAASYDAVIAIESVEHVRNDTGMFAELSRVLNPGGALFISTPDRDLFDAAYAAAHPEAPARTINPFHVREYTETELRALLTTTGFHRIARLRATQPQYAQALVMLCWKP